MAFSIIHCSRNNQTKSSEALYARHSLNVQLPRDGAAVNRSPWTLTEPGKFEIEVQRSPSGFNTYELMHQTFDTCRTSPCSAATRPASSSSQVRWTERQIPSFAFPFCSNRQNTLSPTFTVLSNLPCRQTPRTSNTRVATSW